MFGNLAAWRRKLVEPEYLFVATALVFGLIMVVVMPPFMAPDENAHLWRTYQITSGGLVSNNEAGQTGGKLPTDLYNFTGQLFADTVHGGASSHLPVAKYLKTKINTKKTEFVQFETVAVYSPFSYIPQSVGVGIARITYDSVLNMLYLGRLANLLAFIAMVFLAIRLTPIGKWVLVIVGLFPMTIQQASSLSSDVMTIGLAFIAVAYFLRLWQAQQRLSRRQVINILVLGVLLGLTKQTNTMLILPYLLLPAKSFANGRRRVAFMAGILAASFGAALFWYAIIKLRHYNLNYSGTPGVDMNLQAKFILKHPLKYLGTLFRSFIYYPSGANPLIADFYWSSLVGVFSWITYQLPLLNVIFAYGLLLLGLLAYPTIKLRAVTTTLRLWMLLVFLGSILAIATLLYLVWTPVGAAILAGIQGRYFIPLIPLLIPVFATSKVRVSFQKQAHFALIVGVVSGLNLLMMLFETMHYFHHFA